MTYQPEWDIDAAFGDEGEQTVRALLNLQGARIEVKRKRVIDPQFYVETDCDPGARGEYRPSGISITRADYWAFVISDTGIAVFVPTRVLRSVLGEGLDVQCKQGRYPTRGKLLSLSVVLCALREARA